MFEKIPVQDVVKPLYSMKRKLVVSKPNVDTMAWKKQQTEYQWKYKQKAISDLHSYVTDKGHTTSRTTSFINSDMPSFPSIDFASRLKDEEKKMEEFDNFMRGIHDYLEKETDNEEESDFKWVIQSYLDLIEEDQTEVAVSEIKFPAPFSVSKADEIKERLQENSRSRDFTKKEKQVGKIDVSFLEKHPDTHADKSRPVITGINKNITSQIKAQIESHAIPDAPSEKVFVSKKVIQLPNTPVSAPLKRQIDYKEWKYKQKTISDLQQFVKKNQDIAPSSIVNESFEQIDTKTLLERSKKMLSNCDNKETEFQAFLNELDAFSKSPSNANEEASFKEGIKQYISLIEDSNPAKLNIKMPVIDSALKISSIKSKLSDSKETVKPKKTPAPIGKLSKKFSIPSNEKGGSVMSRDREMVTKPGYTNFVKRTLEQKTKFVRSSSDVCVNFDKLKREKLASFESHFMPGNAEKVPQKYAHSLKEKNPESNRKVSEVLESKSRWFPKECKDVDTKNAIKTEWDHIQDPQERKNAILKKYGFKPAKEYCDEDTSDIEDYLNYENLAESHDYSEKLKELYSIDDSFSETDEESSPVSQHNEKGSFSSLLNIMHALRKSKMSKKFSDSLIKANNFGKDSYVKPKSQINPAISASCSNIKHLFESGSVYNSENDQTRKEKDCELFRTSQKIPLKDVFMQSVNGDNCHVKVNSGFDSLSQFNSLSSLKGNFENKESSYCPEYLTEGLPKRGKKLSFPTNIIGRNDEERHYNDQEYTVTNELEELRKSQGSKSLFRIERGISSQNDGSSRLRRSISCTGISEEKMLNDLDEDTLRDVSVSNKMIKAMFESAAPKYKFGGSGSNLSINSSKENLLSCSNKKRSSLSSSKPSEDRKWVLDSINKYFDVIVEENESSSESYDNQSNCSFSEESEGDSLSLSENNDSESDNEDNYQSTARIRGLFSSVVSSLSKSMGNLAQTELVSNLKKNIGSHVNLRSSFQNIDT